MPGVSLWNDYRAFEADSKCRKKYIQQIHGCINMTVKQQSVTQNFTHAIVVLNTTLILFPRGRNLAGIESQVFLPIKTTFCFAEKKKKNGCRMQQTGSFQFQKASD